jgi:hypothetical protein
MQRSRRFSRGVAQSGSAPALGAGGREFESRRPDQPSHKGYSWLSQPITGDQHASTNLQTISQRHAIWQRQIKRMVFGI